MDKKKRYATDPVYRKAVIESVKAYRAANKDEINAQSRDRYANDPEFRAKKLGRNPPHARRSKLWKRYGLSIEGYEAMAARQGGVCIICSNPPTGKRLAVDHDRKTRKLRDLLCYKCNVGLGYYNHDPALMRRGADYLDYWIEEHEQTPSPPLIEDRMRRRDLARPVRAVSSERRKIPSRKKKKKGR